MVIVNPEVGTRTTWTIDPAHTTIEFGAKHMMFTTVKGRFPIVSGTIVGDVNNPTNAEVDALIAADSITTGNDQRDTHLRSEDFLHAENYPEITFKSTRVERGSGDSLKVFGNLTIRGVTREIELDTTVNGYGTTPFGQEVVGVSATTSINRKDYGLNWNVALEAGGWLVGDTIKIAIEVEAVKQ